jgi:hypothetical protein
MPASQDSARPSQHAPREPRSGEPRAAEARSADPDARGLGVVPAAELDAAQLSRLHRIYEAAFPPHLQAPLAELAALRLLAAADWVFLRYYAIAADRRRTGLGLRFWRQLGPSVAADGWPARIAFEVEDPAEAQDNATELQVRWGRIGFWQSCGAVALTVPGYVMAAITRLGQPEPMVLMAADPDRVDAVSADGLAQLVRAIYTEHYRLGLDDPLVRTALASLESERDPEPEGKLCPHPDLGPGSG